MHEEQGLFCKTVFLWKLDKFTDPRKNVNGLNLGRLGAHHGPRPTGAEAGPGLTGPRGDEEGVGPCWRWKWPRRVRRGGYGRVALCSTENRGAAALELAMLTRAGLR